MEHLHFEVRGGLRIAADAQGPMAGRPVVFLHGGGQTRHSWKDSVAKAAKLGYRGYALDARGHGESSYDPAGIYTLDTFTGDLLDVLPRVGKAPILVGASLGGITALLAAGEGGPAVAGGLVLVDVAARTNPVGVRRIQGFMRAHPQGFATVREAAQAVADFATHRATPASTAGLERNLRKRGDRYFWHWDQRFLDTWPGSHQAGLQRLEAAARRLDIPVLIVHAGKSDVIGQEEVEHLQRLVPHAQYARVEQAGHMVVGDRNSEFNQAVFGFLSRHAAPGP